jgi:hypothetical protein
MLAYNFSKNQLAPIIEWLTTAPQGSIAIATATLAALVTITVTFLTQWILGRRARTDLLTKKLEELYLTLNELTSHNGTLAENIFLKPSPYEEKKEDIEPYTEWSGIDLLKKITMLVRLYFPKLSRSHSAINIKHKILIDMIVDHKKISLKPGRKILSAAQSYRSALVAMEAEIILNRRVLVKDYFFLARYKNLDPLKFDETKRDVTDR